MGNYRSKKFLDHRMSATLELDQVFFQITNGWSRGYPHTHTFLVLTPPSHTHTFLVLTPTPHTPTYSCSHPPTHTHILVLTPPPTHTHTYSCSHPPPPHTHTHTHILVLTPPPTHTHTLKVSNFVMFGLTLTLTPTHTFLPSQIGDDVAGCVRTVNKFMQVVVRGGGHIFPFDQPERALNLIQNFVNMQ